MSHHVKDSQSSTPSRLSSDSTSSGDIEMANLEEIGLTPKPKDEQKDGFRHLHHEHDSDEDSDREDEGNRALLGTPGERPRGREREDDDDTVWKKAKRLTIETAPTLLFTTVGLLLTGELLDHVSHWQAMTLVNELIMIIPVILNLKGNLEMNLSARLGTAANVGELDTPASRRSIILGNLSLLQVQAAVVSFIAANVSFLLSLVMPTPPDVIEDPFPGWDNDTTTTTIKTLFFLHARGPTRPHPPPVALPQSGLPEYIMVASCAMLAACLSSLLLGSFMCGLVVVCRRFGLDPDNIAPPIASCLGDLVTLFLLGIVSSALINHLASPLPGLLALLVVGTAITCAVITRRNPHVRDLLTQGWSPLLGAMVISSGTGIVLDLFVSRYKGFALLAIVISGLPGSVGSIFVSRLSTALHAAALPTTPRTASRQPSARLVMVTLLLVTFPIEVIFLGTIRALGWLHLPKGFIALSVLFFCIAVITSLLLAQLLTNVLWKRGLDPDIYAMPLHSALMDLVGQLLLVTCFEIVSLFTQSVVLPPSGKA